MLCPANADASNLEAQLSPNAPGWPFAAEGGVLPPAGRRVMLCLVLMAVELVIVSTRVQSANYTAYKPSTGRPRAAAPGRWAAPTRWPPSRQAAGFGPRLPPGDARRAWADAPDPTCTLVRPPRTLGVARPAGSTRRGPAPPGRAPPTPSVPGFILDAAESPRPSPVPPRALPRSFPSRVLSSTLSRVRLPPPHSPVRSAPENSSVRNPNPRAGSLNPVRPAAPSGRMTVAVAGQPPSEPRGEGGGAREVWRGGGGAWWGRGGSREQGPRAGPCGEEALETEAQIPEKFLFLIGQEGQRAPSPLPLPKKPHTPTQFSCPSLSGKTAWPGTKL